MNREGYERSMISDEEMRDIFGAAGKCNIGSVSGQRTSEASDRKAVDLQFCSLHTGIRLQ